MTTTVAVTSGLGSQVGRVAAYDRACAVAVTGLASGFYSAAVTGLLTTADGATALAPLATGTVSSAGAVTLTFDTDTAATATLMTGRQADADVRLTIYKTADTAYACVAALKMAPAARAGTTTTATDATAATLAEVRALIDAELAALGDGKPATAKDTPLDADGFTLWDSTAAWVGKFLSWGSLKTALGSVFAALAHTHAGTTNGSKLAQANTHELADTDNATSSLHHTIGTTATTAAAGNHTHTAYQPLATLTAAGSRYRATAAGTVAEQKCLVALAEAGAGAWAPALTAGAHHTVTRSGIWSGITPSGLEIGEGCTVTITGAFATTTTGITADATDALADIAAASVLLVIWREASGYRAVCWEKA